MDNSTTFEAKVTRVCDFILQALGEPTMHLTERRFLLPPVSDLVGGL